MDEAVTGAEIERRRELLDQLVEHLERAADAATDRERLFAFRQAVTLAAALLAGRDTVGAPTGTPPPWAAALPPSPLGMGEFLARFEELLHGAGVGEATSQALVVEANEVLENPPDPPLAATTVEQLLRRARRWLAGEAQALAGGPQHRPETELDQLRRRLWGIVKMAGGALVAKAANQTTPTVDIGVGDTVVPAVDIAQEAGRRLMERGLLEASGAGQQPGRF